jgi:acetyl esterase/lipase
LNMQLEKIQVWPDRDDVFLQAYFQEEIPQIEQGRTRAAVLILPGGAYLYTSDRETEPVALRFAGLGFHVFVLRYSVFLKSGQRLPDWSPRSIDFTQVNPGSAYPGPLADLAQAMNRIREQAGRFRLDPERIALCGFSAGGHLALSMGVHWNSEFLQNLVPAAGGPVRPAALILGYPLTDILSMRQAMRSLGPEDAARIDFWHLFCLAFFGQPDPADAELAAASPARHVHADVPPSFIWHTAEDATVPVAQSLSLAQALAGAGVPCELHIFEKGPHALSLADESTAAAPDQLNPAAQAWFGQAAAFLRRHLPLFADPS